MAMIAIAARFSNDAFFESRQLEAIETYAGVAWNALFNRAFADDYDLLEIQAVQAINILAVVNFTGMGASPISITSRMHLSNLFLSFQPDSINWDG